MKLIGIKINNILLQDNNLTGTDKIIIGAVASLTRKRGFCNATDKYLASELKVSARTVGEAIAVGKKAGYLARVKASSPAERNLVIKGDALMKNDGLWISGDILSMDNISSTQKIILAAVDDQCKKYGACTSGKKELSIMCSCTEDTIKKALRDLETKGFIKRSSSGPYRTIELTFRHVIKKGGLRMVV